jgi:ABC-type polysaccharide/polyol phosphate export permease
MSSVDVLLSLTEAELKDTRGLTLMGFLKWLMEPVLAVAVYVLLIQIALHQSQPAYPLFVMCALLPWRYFQESIGRGLTLVNSYGNVIAARRLPRGILPLVPVATEGASLLVGMLLLPPLMIHYGVGASPALLALPLVLVVLVILVAGPTYLATVYGVHFPDFRAPVQTVLRLGFFVSTALVSPGKIGGSRLSALFRANPMSSVFDSYRDVLIKGRFPTAGHLLYPLAVGIVLMAIGCSLYLWWEPQIAKEV